MRHVPRIQRRKFEKKSFLDELQDAVKSCDPVRHGLGRRCQFAGRFQLHSVSVIFVCVVDCVSKVREA